MAEVSWAASGKGLGLPSFSWRHGRERAVLSSGVLQKPKKWCLSQSAGRFWSALPSCPHSPHFSSLAEGLWGAPCYLHGRGMTGVKDSPFHTGLCKGVKHRANVMKPWSANCSAARRFSPLGAGAGAEQRCGRRTSVCQSCARASLPLAVVLLSLTHTS